MGNGVKEPYSLESGGQFFLRQVSTQPHHTKDSPLPLKQLVLAGINASDCVDLFHQVMPTPTERQQVSA